MRRCQVTNSFENSIPGIFVAALAALVGFAPLHAQETDPLEPGTRVRVASPALRPYVRGPNLGDALWGDPVAARARKQRGRVIGNVVRSDSDSLVVDLVGADARVALPWPGVDLLEQSMGRGRSRVRWTAGGAVVGGVAGAVLMARWWDPDACRNDQPPGLFGGGLSSCDPVRREDALVDYVGGAAVLGGVVGYLIAGGERWKAVQLPLRIGVDVRDGGAVGVRGAAKF
jgi:outer membrane lipoprotein SlyB